MSHDPAPSASPRRSSLSLSSPRGPPVAPGHRHHLGHDRRLVRPGAAGRDRHPHQRSARPTRARVTSDARGEFAFRAVPPGLYTVRVELAGFRAFEQRNNVLNASGQLDVWATSRSEIGALNEVVSVVADGHLRRNKNSDYSGLLTTKQIEQIQTKGRDVMSLLKLLPGVPRRSRHRGDGRLVRIERAEHQRHAARLEPGDGRRPERQRAVGHFAGFPRRSTWTPSPK